MKVFPAADIEIPAKESNSVLLRLLWLSGKREKTRTRPSS